MRMFSSILELIRPAAIARFRSPPGSHASRDSRRFGSASSMMAWIRPASFFGSCRTMPPEVSSMSAAWIVRRPQHGSFGLISTNSAFCSRYCAMSGSSGRAVL